jgi:hypothetical protein
MPVTRTPIDSRVGDGGAKRERGRRGTGARLLNFDFVYEHAKQPYVIRDRLSS